MTTQIQCVRSESPCASCLAFSALGFLSVLFLHRSSWRLAKNVMSNGNRDEILSGILACCGHHVSVVVVAVAVAVLLLLYCCWFVVVVVVSFCVRVRGEILGFVRKRTTANAFTKDVSIDQERRLGDSRH